MNRKPLDAPTNSDELRLGDLEIKSFERVEIYCDVHPDNVVDEWPFLLWSHGDEWGAAPWPSSGTVGHLLVDELPLPEADPGDELTMGALRALSRSGRARSRRVLECAICASGSGPLKRVELRQESVSRLLLMFVEALKGQGVFRYPLSGLERVVSMTSDGH